MSERVDISESELHAYVDGALDADRARAVTRSLAHDPALAKRVAAFRADMVMLKQVYAPMTDRPVPGKWLALAQKPRPARPSWRLVGAIAAVLLLALALLPFVYRALAPAPSGEIVSMALAARQDPAGTVIPVTGTPTGRYDGTLSAAISQHVKVPDLTQMGYRLTGIRLYPDAPGGGAAELAYHGRDDRLFTLYLRRSDGSARFDQFERAGLRVCIWQDDQLSVVMAGNVTTAAMQRLVSLTYTRLIT
jgi:anti-sigma factor RsiW